MAYTYDGTDRLIAAVAVDGNKTTFAYDTFDRMTSLVFGDGEKAEIIYDAKTGYVTKQVGPGSKVTDYKYGKEKETVWALVQDNEGGKSRYEYIDAENKIIFVDKSGNKTITTVTACCGKPLSIKDPKGVGEDFRYDDKGNLISKTDAAKKTTTFAYEPRFNQISEIKNHDGTSLRFLYDKNGNLSFASGSEGKHVKLTYERHGKIETMVDHNENVVVFAYNSFGKPLSIEKKVKAKRVGMINVSYDKTGEITNVAYEPKDPEIVQNIKDTLGSFLRLLKPSGIDFEI
jgi:YD repeat-containing protein